MAMLPNTIDPNEVAPAPEMGPVPEGLYLAEIISSEMKTTRSGTGQYLSLAYRILDEHYDGRMIWHNLNLLSPSDVAQRIAQQQLSAICHACGHMQPVTDSEQLHNLPHVIKVTVTPAKDGYEAQNRIKAWEAPGSKVREVAAPKAPASAPTPAPAGKPPWASQ